MGMGRLGRGVAKRASASAKKLWGTSPSLKFLQLW